MVQALDVSALHKLSLDHCPPCVNKAVLLYYTHSQGCNDHGLVLDGALKSMM